MTMSQIPKTDGPVLVRLEPQGDEARRLEMVEEIQGALKLAEAGGLDSIVMVLMKPGHKYRVVKVGSVRRMETVGFLERAKLDILTVED
jgi:MOSC domain-containing protein YiiM